MGTETGGITAGERMDRLEGEIRAVRADEHIAIEEIYERINEDKREQTKVISDMNEKIQAIQIKMAESTTKLALIIGGFVVLAEYLIKKFG